MLFIGHFSFDERDPEGQVKHGYLTGIVDADSAEGAVAKLEAHIRKMKSAHKAMHNVIAVYIEEILRIKKIPQTPMITRIQSSEGEFPHSVSHVLPGVDEAVADAFGFAPDVEKQNAPGDDGYIESEPFIRFDE